MSLVVGVEPNICNLATVVEHVVRDGHVVRTDFAAAVAVVVRRAVGHDTDTTVNEVVVVDDVAVATVHDDTNVTEVDGVVEFFVALVVDEGVVRQLEHVEFVSVAVSVAHGTDDVGNTGDGGVVHVNVQRVVSVADGEALWHTGARHGDSGHICIVHVEGAFAAVVRVHSVVTFEVVGGGGDPRAAVPVVLALSEVHEWSVHHDGFASQVVAAVASEVSIFHQSVVVGPATG